MTTLPVESLDKSTRGNASQFFVAGELCRRGWVAVVTLGNTPNTDILCSNREGSKFVHIQVKTFVPGSRTVSVGRKAENDFGKTFVWVLAGIPHHNTDKPFEFFVIPSAEMGKNVKTAQERWLSDVPTRRDSDVRIVTLPPRTNYIGWDISPYRNNWDLIEALPT